MNICFFTENSYKGGLDTFLINLFNAWPNRDDTLTLMCNSSHPGLSTIRALTKRKIRIDEYTYLFTTKAALGQTTSPIWRSFPVRAAFVLAFRALQYPVLLPWYLLTLTLMFRKSEFDRLLVVNGGYPASLICRCAAIAWRLSGKKSPAVFNFHNTAAAPPRYARALENIIDAAVIMSTRTVVSVSQACLDTLSNRPSFRACHSFQYIHNGIEDKAHHESWSSSLDVGFRYCLFLGTYEQRKGHRYLLEAFKEVINDFPEMKLVIHGFGKDHEKSYVSDIVYNLGLSDHVRLCDFTTETGPLIRNAKILLVSSQAFESFGLTVIEAMSLKTPVVTTDVGGLPEVMAGADAGYVCSKDEPKEFAKAIKAILRDPAHAEQLGLNGRKAFEKRFTSARMAAQYMRLVQQ